MKVAIRALALVDSLVTLAFYHQILLITYKSRYCKLLDRLLEGVAKTFAKRAFGLN